MPGFLVFQYLISYTADCGKGDHKFCRKLRESLNAALRKLSNKLSASSPKKIRQPVPVKLASTFCYSLYSEQKERLIAEAAFIVLLELQEALVTLQTL